MNGCTSSVAAILRDGVKITQPRPAPRVVIADTDILAAAPLEMIQSGFGDLLSKPVSNADWAIANILTDSPYSEEAEAIIRHSSDLVSGIAPIPKDRQPAAVERLTAALMLSGIAMTIAGSSSPASGGEHLISHYLDMRAMAEWTEHDLHGRQVTVGTLVSAMLYERIVQTDVSSLDLEKLVGGQPPSDHAHDLRRPHFGDLYQSIRSHAEVCLPSAAELRARLARIKGSWGTIQERALVNLRSAKSLETELQQAGVPTRFSQIGVGPDRARDAIRFARYVRSR